MEIFVNDDKLEFQIEDEKSLKDVIESLNNWLFKNMKVVDAIIIDGKVYTEEIQGLIDYPVDSTEKLELTVININDLVCNSLMETKNYLKEVHKFIDTKEDFTEENIKRIQSGIHWLINIFTRINNIYDYEKVFSSGEFSFSGELNSLKNSEEKIHHLCNSKKYKEAGTLIKNDLIMQINNWFNNIDKLIESKNVPAGSMSATRDKVSEQIYKIIKKIPDMQKLIEMTAMDIQTGHDNEAMTNLQIIIGTLESITALLQLIKSTFSIDYNNIKYNKEPVEIFNKNFNLLLKEMLEGMKIKDTVLMSDLLTYELLPKVEQYTDILKIIAKEINIEIN